MPIHQNQDGTWQWGKSGKKYKKKEDAIKQMKAIFANGYVEKHASYTDVLGMIKKAAQDPSGFISSVAKQDPRNFSAIIPSVKDLADKDYSNRYFLWKAQGMDDPHTRNNIMRRAYFDTLFQRQSSWNPYMVRRNSKGKIFSAGIGSMDKPALDQAKLMGLLPKNFGFLDLVKRKNIPTVVRAIAGLQDRFYNKAEIGNSKNKIKGRSFHIPSDVGYMYIPYSRGRNNTKKAIIAQNKLNRGERISTSQLFQYNKAKQNRANFKRNFEQRHPTLYPLVYNPAKRADDKVSING